ncbi:MAG: epoxyqueuosine reductase QueH [Dehalococcoidia bacterium]|nr:epoxyqueuosine reductase QueH [Dehalococcoidia bacterium]
MSKILLHICCGPCTTYPVTRLREEGFEVTGFWYNPNVHPFSEHQRRLQAMQDFARAANLPVIVTEGYEMIEYLRTVSAREGDRCPECYRMRLSRAAQAAKASGFDCFTSTLLISPHQDQELLRKTGEEAGAEYGVTLYFENFRRGFSQSRQMSKDLGLYRQQYCGCIYSEWERYAGLKVKDYLNANLHKNGQ